MALHIPFGFSGYPVFIVDALSVCVVYFKNGASFLDDDEPKALEKWRNSSPPTSKQWWPVGLPTDF